MNLSFYLFSLAQPLPDQRMVPPTGFVNSGYVANGQVNQTPYAQPPFNPQQPQFNPQSQFNPQQQFAPQPQFNPSQHFNQPPVAQGNWQKY